MLMDQLLARCNRCDFTFYTSIIKDKRKVALYIMSRLSYLSVWIKCAYELLHIKVQLDHDCYCHAMVDSYNIEMGHFLFVAAGKSAFWL